jgi:integrase
LAVKGRLISAARVPDVELLRLDNIRQGFFERAEIEALLQRIPDRDLHDFIRTGQRKGEIAKLTWDMLDRSGSVWVLRLPGAIAKNKTGRSLGLAGETRTIMERRLARRRLDCPLIFHRTSKGKAGQSIKDLRCAWRNTLEAAQLPKTDSSMTSGDPRFGH